MVQKWTPAVKKHYSHVAGKEGCLASAKMSCLHYVTYPSPTMLFITKGQLICSLMFDVRWSIISHADQWMSDCATCRLNMPRPSIKDHTCAQFPTYCKKFGASPPKLTLVSHRRNLSPPEKTHFPVLFAETSCEMLSKKKIKKDTLHLMSSHCLKTQHFGFVNAEGTFPISTE